MEKIRADTFLESRCFVNIGDVDKILLCVEAFSKMATLFFLDVSKVSSKSRSVYNESMPACYEVDIE